jgi:hypothetical protein
MKLRRSLKIWHVLILLTFVMTMQIYK